MVYVLSLNGQLLMPTIRHGKVRRLLIEGYAYVVQKCPFTIRLTYPSGDQTQEITLGIDTGCNYFGKYATPKRKDLYEQEDKL